MRKVGQPGGLEEETKMLTIAANRLPNTTDATRTGDVTRKTTKAAQIPQRPFTLLTQQDSVIVVHRSPQILQTD
jgi:hypothetical protein